MSSPATHDGDSLDALLNEARQYARFEEESAFRASVAQWVAAKDEANLRAHFRPRIAFGTAGLRARMAPGYHNINCLVVLQTSQAFARYIEAQARAGAGEEEEKQRAAVERVHEQGLVLGYDGRHRSRRFAEIAASAFLSAGFRVHLFSRMVATPFVPFGLLHLKAAAGVVVTASHNPKDDNGEERAAPMHVRERGRDAMNSDAPPL
jgi:phosphomannomutase